MSLTEERTALMKERLALVEQSALEAQMVLQAQLTGPPKCSLAMYAARSMIRHPQDAQTWVLIFRDGSTDIFVDPNDSVATLKDWMNTGVRIWFHVPEKWGKKPLEPTRRRPAPLVVSGLVKVGKTFEVLLIVTTVMALDVDFDIGQRYEPVVLQLDDELQAFLLPLGVDGAPDIEGARFLRDNFLKDLLLYGPRHVIWTITGSSMALVWMNIAEAPPNGHVLIQHGRTLHLPAIVDDTQMHLVWNQLQERAPDALPVELRLASEPTPAFLTLLVEEYISKGQPRDVREFVGVCVQDYLVSESVRDWWYAFALMSRAERRAIFDLAFVTHGLDPVLALNRGLSAFLTPHLVCAPDGLNCYLRSPHHRQLIQVPFDCAGRGCGLLHCPEYQGPGAADFKLDVQALACLLDTAVPWQQWHHQPWFSTAINSQWNNSDRALFQNNPENYNSAELLFIFYLRLCRNCLAHEKPWPEQLLADPLARQLPPFEGKDVDLVMVLPDLLGIPLTAILEKVARALA
ncbi:g9365 [Coccomyxa elongata]